MSRPLALCLVLLVLILTSQSEWKQQTRNETELTAALTKQNEIPTKREVVKEQVSFHHGHGITEITDFFLIICLTHGVTEITDFFVIVFLIHWMLVAC